MSDLIDRQAAISAIQAAYVDTQEGWDKHAVKINVGLTKAMHIMQELPSVQPETHDKHTETRACNCISRQAAIELCDWYQHEFVECDYAFGELANEIYKLPSVQPETAKRIVGKSRDGMTLWYQCDMCNEPVDAQDNFCRGCGRRLTDG